MIDKEQAIEALFSAGEHARAMELRRALHDPKCWIEQVVVLLVMVMMCTALTYLLATTMRLAGADESLSLKIGVLVVMGVLPFNPRRMFWRNPFVDRADQAFNQEVQRAWMIERL